MFDNRLKLLRIQRNLTQQEVADSLKIPKSTYTNYESDKREPTAVMLKHIADFYGVSCDYLLGFEECTQPLSQDEITAQIISLVNEFTISEKKDVKRYCDFVKYSRRQGE